MSQSSLNVPTTGPSPPTTFAGIINGALDAVVTKNSGATAPANFPTTSGGAPTAFQDWADTSPGGGLIDEKEFDGSTWLNKGAMDQSGHVWMPKVGGGSGTIAAAGTTDIGSVRQSYVLITGSSLSTPITAFGSNALLNTGETRFLKFAASGIITHNGASMIMPGAADLSFNAGDTLQAVYLGGGNWLGFNYRSNLSALGRNTGDVFEAWGTSTRPGALIANGGTIGNGSSGGTSRANADTANLFIFLYINDTSLTVSGGRTAPGTTRANAITDFNLNKTIALPDLSLTAARYTSTQYLTTVAAGQTYTAAANCRFLRAFIKGAGGGGSKNQGGFAGGTAGGDTTFNSVVAKGGGGGNAQTGGTGGTGGSGSATFRSPGSDGGHGGNNGGGYDFGGSGAPGHWGNGAGSGGDNAGGTPVVGGASTGGGGGGDDGGMGGGSGELAILEITNPAATYTFTITAGGAGGGAGANKGAAGGSGIIVVEEYCDFGLSHYISL